MTTIYLMRHSEPLKGQNKEKDLLLSNINNPLSENGELLAEEISNKIEFNNLDSIWSSNYVRAINTAKHFTNKNNLKLNISSNFGERVHGIKLWDELPKNFELHQFEDEDYKIGYGESRKEVTARMLKEINNILDNYKDKRVLVIGHSTAIAFLLSTWCDISYMDNYRFKGNIFFDGNWNYCETFKLTFNNKDLIEIENI